MSKSKILLLAAEVLISLIILFFTYHGIRATLYKDKNECNHSLRNEYELFDKYAFSALSSVINSEADPNDPMDLYLVGSTVLNRAEHEIYPSCIVDVIFQKGQYAGISGNFTRSAVSDSVASRLLNDVGRNKDVIFFYNHHTATDKKFIRFLEKNCELVTVTKNHKFFKACEAN
jgi:spore germination cell wall hydrolase CwlJ-like protein